jgi:hypothetical protein
MPVSPSGTVAIEGIIAVLIPLAKAVGLGVVDEFAIVSKDNITITTADRRQTDRQTERNAANDNHPACRARSGNWSRCRAGVVWILVNRITCHATEGFCRRRTNDQGFGVVSRQRRNIRE